MTKAQKVNVAKGVGYLITMLLLTLNGNNDLWLPIVLGFFWLIVK